MKKNWLFGALFGLILVVGAYPTRAGTVISVPTPPTGGGGGGSSNSMPDDWNMWSGTSRGDEYSSAWGNVSGDSMGIPGSVNSYIDWYYAIPGDGQGGLGRDGIQSQGDLYFTISFSTAGDIEKPKEAVNMGTGGNLNINSVTLEEFSGKDGEVWRFFQFEETLSISYSGSYSSWVNTDDGYSSGSLYGSASISPMENLNVMPYLDFNNWEDPIEPEPSWFNEYEARINIYGFVPSGAYTMMTVVPEPATLAMLAIGGGASLCRRSRKENHRRNTIA